MELALALRRGESLLITLVVPLVLLVFFSSVPILPDGDTSRGQFLLPGILALAVISTSMVSLGIATAFERQYGVLKRIGGSPLPRIGLIASKILAVILIQTVQICFLLAVAAVFLGWRPAGQLLTSVALLVLGTLTFSAIGLLMAGALRAEATLAAANGLYLLFLLVGDMIVPLEQLPEWLAWAARLLPAAAFAEALRTTMQGGAIQVTQALLLLGWGLGSLLLAAKTFQWE